MEEEQYLIGGEKPLPLSLECHIWNDRTTTVLSPLVISNILNSL